MFDSFQPTPAISCPACGAEAIETWQGKDGPCCLLVWTQGVRHPSNGDIAPESKLSDADLESMEMPERFVISGWCECGQRTDAICTTLNGVWNSTSVAE